jgi:hypothetical protein
MMRRYIRGTPEERIDAWTVHDGVHRLWQGTMVASKYPVFDVEGSKHYVRRWLYEQESGALPANVSVIAGCGIDRCVSPQCAQAIPHRDALIRADTPVMQNTRKTHCKNGHPLTEGNLYHNISVPTARVCRQCALDAQRRYRAKRRHTGTEERDGKGSIACHCRNTEGLG